MRETEAPDEGLMTFQKENCEGCKFAEKIKVGTGYPCCTYGFQLIIKDGKCETRREE